MNVFDLAKMYNDEGLSLKEIGEKVGLSKSTVQRRLNSEGWKFDKVTGKYVCMVDNLSQEVDAKLVPESGKVVTIEKNQMSEKIINRTYGIPEDLDRELKIKCAIEGTNATQIVREALKKVVEDKYFNFN